MNLIERIEINFQNSINTKQNTLAVMQNSIALAAQLMTHCLLSGKKILSCGNGGAASHAQHFSSLMLNKYQIERPSLPAITLTSDISTLTSIANDYAYNLIFSKQIQALGQNEDILFVITDNGNSTNIISAVNAAHDRGLHIVALTGNNGGEVAMQLNPDDIEIRIPSDSTPRIQETQLLVIHCICDLIDHQLIGQ
ncbi:MAG: SIS domain-containing protein [Gammaproteobacteria bacterium]|nr:SIS domain-containing protein [Gammaproteobacteria bacterium]MDH5735915.1 SIS domain-containing protein [Gammaproteobacteria bacterium]